MAQVEFGSEHTFKVCGVIVKPGSLFKGQVVEIHGQRGEYKVIAKTKEKNKLIIKVEKMPTHLFKTFHNNLHETFGVEAISGLHQAGPTEYLVAYKGKKRWVKKLDCTDVTN